MKRHFLLIIAIFICTSSLSALDLYKTGVTASYYAEDFHGKRTSNGERFNMNDYTCAHKSLPFDTILRVTNLANGKTCNVRVNDRGPFVASREIDLSKAAAIKLGMIGSGTTTRNSKTRPGDQTKPADCRKRKKNYGKTWRQQCGQHCEFSKFWQHGEFQDLEVLGQLEDLNLYKKIRKPRTRHLLGHPARRLQLKRKRKGIRPQAFPRRLYGHSSPDLSQPGHNPRGHKKSAGQQSDRHSK